MTSLDQQLLKLYQKINRKEKLKVHLTHLNEVIAQKEGALRIVSKALAEEQADLDKLEDQTLYTTFLYILGNKKEQVEKARQDYLTQYMQFQGLTNNLKSLKEERSLLEKSYSGLHGIDHEFDALIAEKLKLLKNLKQYPKAISVHTEKIANHKAKIRELELITKRGIMAKKHLHKVVIALEQIEHWGSRNQTSLPRGATKKIDRINKDIYVANNFLQKYEDELYDISDLFQLDYKKEVTLLERFLDQFIDCLITDWIVKNKIENALNLILNIIDKLSRIAGMLEHEKEKTLVYIEEEEELMAEVVMRGIDEKE